jgi:methionyl-tRNA synthetase
MARDIPGAQAPTPGAPYYITTAIAYPNGDPHVGHAYEYIATDALARFKRFDGYDVRFLTGTDVHGLKMAETAAAEGIPTAELARRNSDVFQRMQERLNISFDRFIRTSDADHYEASKEIWRRMNETGDIYLDAYKGWYSVRDERFFTEAETTEGADGVRIATETGAPVTWTEEQTYFFKLSAYADKLLAHYEAHPEFIEPQVRRNEVVSFVSGGLRDLSISRTTFDWGVPVPDHPDHVMYVWVDALTNYLTGVGFPDTSSELFQRFWPADLHMIGKDIIRFHTVYWPAFLMAAGYDVPRRLFVHGFLLMEGHKMSKSLGNVLDPFEVIERFGSDALRFYCLREVSFGQDGSVSAAGFEVRYETELANDWGNLASRVLAMLERYREGVVPQAEPDPELAAGDDGLARVEARVAELLDRSELTQALEQIWLRVRRLNRYVEETRPWELAKDDASAARLDQVLYSLCEGVRVLALLLSAYMPQTSGRLLDALGEPGRSLASFGSRGGGQAIAKLPPLFPRVE